MMLSAVNTRGCKSVYETSLCLLLPASQVTKLGKKHVGDGAEVLFCLIMTELHEDQLLVSDIRRTSDHQSGLL